MPRHPDRKPKPTPRREPVAYAAVVTIVVGVAAFFGFDLDRDVATSVVGIVFVIAQAWARSQVTPTKE